MAHFILMGVLLIALQLFIYWGPIIVLSLIINRIIKKNADDIRKVVALPIALQTAYMVIVIAGMILVEQYYPDYFISTDYITLLLLLVGILWLYLKPSYGPVLLMTAYHAYMAYSGYTGQLSAIIDPFERPHELGWLMFYTHLAFRVYVVWLLFSKIALLKRKAKRIE